MTDTVVSIRQTMAFALLTIQRFLAAECLQCVHYEIGSWTPNGGGFSRTYVTVTLFDGKSIKRHDNNNSGRSLSGKFVKILPTYLSAIGSNPRATNLYRANIVLTRMRCAFETRCWGYIFVRPCVVYAKLRQRTGVCRRGEELARRGRGGGVYARACIYQLLYK